MDHQFPNLFQYSQIINISFCKFGFSDTYKNMKKILLGGMNHM